MISLLPITLDELKPLIAYAYAGDNDLIEKYQADTTRTYQQCVDFNFNEIAELSSAHKNVSIWEIWRDEGDLSNAIGYCVTINNEDQPGMLLSYSINKKYRDAEILTSWLMEVEEELGTPYYTGLWAKNTRAISFFEKNGFALLPASEREDYVYLVKNIELLDRKALLAASAITSD